MVRRRKQKPDRACFGSACGWRIAGSQLLSGTLAGSCAGDLVYELLGGTGETIALMLLNTSGFGPAVNVPRSTAQGAHPLGGERETYVPRTVLVVLSVVAVILRVAVRLHAYRLHGVQIVRSSLSHLLVHVVLLE